MIEGWQQEAFVGQRIWHYIRTGAVICDFKGKQAYAPETTAVRLIPHITNSPRGSSDCRKCYAILTGAAP
jgi:hypothetical protein